MKREVIKRFTWNRVGMCYEGRTHVGGYSKHSYDAYQNARTHYTAYVNNGKPITGDFPTAFKARKAVEDQLNQ